jgi:hypothetical protein
VATQRSPPHPVGPAELLRRRAALRGAGHGELFPRFRNGEALICVTRPRGRVSCSVRWHGPRPALLWDAPADVTVRAPALDPAWSSTEATGEALLSGG